MTMTIDQIREQQRGTWNKFSTGWKKQDDLVTGWLRPVGEKLIEVVELRDDYIVLDAATGTGQPGLSAATKLAKGTVIGSDISEEMLRIAQENARTMGIQNYSTKVCDESSLPFPDDHFDAVLCRFGVMYFPDMYTGIKELVRVVKPGRKIALSAWTEPGKNPWATTASRVVNQMLQLPPPPSDAPGIFRCADYGTLSSLLNQAGLHNVGQVEVSGEIAFDSAEHYWEFITDVVAPIATALNNVGPEERQRVKDAVIKAAEEREQGNVVSFGWSAWVGSGEK